MKLLVHYQTLVRQDGLYQQASIFCNKWGCFVVKAVLLCFTLLDTSVITWYPISIRVLQFMTNNPTLLSDWAPHNVLISLRLGVAHSGQFRLESFVRNYFSVSTLLYEKESTYRGIPVRSVNKSSDTHNCIQNVPQYAICVVFTPCLYYKALKLILCKITCK